MIFLLLFFQLFHIQVVSGLPIEWWYCRGNNDPQWLELVPSQSSHTTQTAARRLPQMEDRQLSNRQGTKSISPEWWPTAQQPICAVCNQSMIDIERYCSHMLLGVLICVLFPSCQLAGLLMFSEETNFDTDIDISRKQHWYSYIFNTVSET